MKGLKGLVASVTLVTLKTSHKRSNFVKISLIASKSLLAQ